MEVVSLRRLESQKISTAPKRSVFYLVPKMITVGLIISVIAIVTFIKVESQPDKVIYKYPQLSESLNTRNNIDKIYQTLNPEQISPDSNVKSVIFSKKLLDDLSPKNPDCKIIACLALTFDDGPDPQATPLILDSLEKNFAHATFFQLGSRIPGQEDILHRIEESNNEIGNHSWSHPSFFKLKKDKIKYQITKTQQIIKASGVPEPKLFRPPYGELSTKNKKDINMPIILWNIDPKDWSYKNPAKIAKVVIKQAKPGAIIVMHDKLATAKALPYVLRDLRNKYRFVTVSQLLNLQPGVKGVYVGR